MKTNSLPRLVSLIAGLAALSPFAGPAKADVSLTGTRTQFFMDEPIELAVTGTGPSLSVEHEDGSVLHMPVAPGTETSLVTMKANTLKPGKYTAANGGERTATFQVAPPFNINAYFTAQWVHHGGTAENAAAKGGWMYFNSDYVPLHPRVPQPGDVAEAYVAARMRPFALSVLGGGHQLDLDLVNDWGDANVQRAIVWRKNLAALSNRLYPLAGLHTYDEPGLTWWPVPTGEVDDKGAPKMELSPYAIPHQLDEFKKLTGKTIQSGPFGKVSTSFAKDMDAWVGFLDMRMKYLEQAWWADRWGTDAVNPAFLTVNQVSNSYSPANAVDGVDSRQGRPYDVLSGHGGYSDLSFGTYQPFLSAEAFAGYAQGKPHYYLPMWYTHIPSTMRNAVWMTWGTKLEGMLYTPEQDFAMDNGNRGYYGTTSILEVADINRRLALVGDVMNKLPKTPAPIAVLFSHSQAAWDVADSNKNGAPKFANPPTASPHSQAATQSFWRLMDMGLTPNWVDEVEATDKGAAFLRQWKVLVLPRITILSPALRKALTEYIAGGGKLIQFKQDGLQLPGAIISDAGFGDTMQFYTDENMEKNPASQRDLNWRAWTERSAGDFVKVVETQIGERPYRSSTPEVFLNAHRSGAATYLLMANNAQSRENPRGLKHELIPAETTIALPAGGVVYDLFNGGTVPVIDGQAKLYLPAGDGACWLHLPAAPGAPKTTAGLINGSTLHFTVDWGTAGYLPFRLRLIDPSGRRVEELLRATSPRTGTTHYELDYPLGANAAPGEWTVETHEWLTGVTTKTTVQLKPAVKGPWSAINDSPVSIYFDDAKKIRELFAGNAAQPVFDKMNWDSKRVFALDPKKFTVFGPPEEAGKIAAALRAKGMSVEVNPAYKIENYVREPNRGGAGPLFRLSNFENIYAHAIVLPGHPLTEASRKRGHINRPVTADFPGKGRAYIQWGLSGYQAGWHNVWVMGDMTAGMNWLLAAIDNPQAKSSPALKDITVSESPAPPAAKTAAKPNAWPVSQAIKTPDTPVGIGKSLDGKTQFSLLSDGSVSAYDGAGKALWRQQALLIGGDLSVSPRGDRIAVAGYPGLLVLDANTGKVLGGYRAPAAAWAMSRPLMTRPAWSSNGALVGAGWVDNYKSYDKCERLPAVVLDADGREVKRWPVTGDVMGAAFVPGKETLLLGMDDLTAFNARTGEVAWKGGIGGAQTFAFSADGKSVVAGGWAKNVGLVNLADGALTRKASFSAVVGGVALLPKGDIIAAVWGGTKPLYVVHDGVAKPEPFFQSRFGFQNVQWSSARNALYAAEQGGDLWLLGEDGKVLNRLTDNGTTAYRMETNGGSITTARTDRTIQTSSPAP